MISANPIDVVVEHITLWQLLSTLIFQRREKWLNDPVNNLDKGVKETKYILETDQSQCQC